MTSAGHATRKKAAKPPHCFKQALARGKAKAEQDKTKAEHELETIKEQIRLMATQQYGRRSKRQTDDPTSDLFNEAEALIEAEEA